MLPGSQFTNGGDHAELHHAHQLDRSGHQGVREHARSAEAAAELATKFGGNSKGYYWTMGAYDLVGMFEAPDDESATAYALALSSLGNVRTTTLRAYDAAEMREIIDKAAS